MSKRFSFFLLVLVFFSGPGFALEVRDILKVCDSGVREDRGLCSGYIMGHVDGRVAMGGWRVKNKDCKISLPYGKITEIVIADLKIARREDWPAGEAIKDILSKRFACVQSVLEK